MIKYWPLRFTLQRTPVDRHFEGGYDLLAERPLVFRETVEIGRRKATSYVELVTPVQAAQVEGGEE